MAIIAENKKARFDYEILDKYEAGIVLSGQEVKSVRNGRINLAGSYVVIRGEEAWLLNSNIPAYQPKNAPIDYDPKRTRKLLLRKSEINELIGKNAAYSLTLVPLKLYTRAKRLKLEIGLARPKKKADKREVIRKKEINREIRRNMGV